MKHIIRTLLCLGSICIILANPTISLSLLAGSLFFLANFLSLIYNLKDRRIKPITRKMRSLMQ